MYDPVLIKKHYHRDGFIHLPGFISSEMIQNFKQNLERFLVEIIPDLPSEHVFLEDKSDASTLKQIQHLNQYDSWFQEQFTKGAFPELATLLLESSVVPKNMQYFNKPPGIGKPTPPHQDGFYFMLRPCRALTMWLALDEVNEENGCVRYVRGSHRSGLRSHRRTQTLGFSQGIPDYPSKQDLTNEVCLPVSPGDLLVHDALTVHRADGNRSMNRHRRAIGFIYYSHQAKEDCEAHDHYQRELSADLKKAGRI